MGSSDTFKSAFIFKSYKCFTDCNEVVDLNTGSKVKSIVIRNDISKSFRAAYLYGEGLKEIKKGKYNDKNNILGEFLGIKKNDINSVMSFFNKYGFLFDLSGYDKYVNVNIEDILYLKDNLEALVNLLNAQCSNEINYKKLLDSVLFLLLREDREIRINDRTIYKSNNNVFLSNIKNATKTNLMNGNNIVHIPRSDGGNDIVYRAKDSISEDGYHDINVYDYDMLLEGEEQSLEFIRQIFKLYVLKNSPIFTTIEGLAIEFLFHFVQQVSLINLESISLDIPFQDECYTKLESKECTSLSKSLHKISKLLIERELNYHLSEIRPIYNIETMQPNWNLPSLLSAMYLSLFYLDSKQASYRACQNVNCGQFFLVTKTNSIKKYCCVDCTNAVSQRKYRYKKRK
ncbi:hypothetical protein FDF69_06580 [Clostridium sporogenes]|uniref:hypothetical protein n=1 Tax=Clostridium sporogenes TaxID=1509 RepID=UPI0013D3F3C6|nr:hypothetical protein [Clostridium sporogenes]NFF65950.1 hypothetical protein [Clostridium sporogenes]NFF98339.1 hypothetical protein [Clostridium sporogenes]NFG05417.1 hypothetical protein [Clostridium sporogenes]NFG50912.1 hypothetical protein [Clostridium sporogenes]NFP83256.1 hypothetical protein [Clostridium sporogenes]